MEKKALIVIVIVVIAAWFYSERYMYVGSEEGSHYVMNKWTGKIYRVGTGNTGLIGERGGLMGF